MVVLGLGLNESGNLSWHSFPRGGVDILMHHLVSIFSDLQPCIVIRIVVIRVILRTFVLTIQGPELV